MNNKFICNIDKINNGKKLIIAILNLKGFIYIFNLIEQLILFKKYNILINITYYFPFSINSIKISSIDYYILIILLKTLPINITEVYYLKYTFDQQNLREILLTKQNNYFVIIHRKLDFDNTNFDHVSIYNKENDYFYNILDNKSQIYIDNTSCAINCFCYILNSLNINFTNLNIITLFKILQINPLLVTNIYKSQSKLYNKFINIHI